MRDALVAGCKHFQHRDCTALASHHLCDILLFAGMVWVEGDNAAVSRDSREFGAVPAGLVRARVAAVVWPPSQARLVERTYASNRIAHPY